LPNIRIIYDNAADRAALATSSTAGDLSAANLLTDIKAAVWRSVGPTGTITAIWAKAETIAGVALPFCNLTSLATVRVRGYVEAGDALPLFDTGAVYACPAPVLGLWNWGSQPFGSNAFAYGGAAYGRVWIPVPGAVKKLVIDIDDSTNPAGYVEVSRLVCGAYWSPQYNFDRNAPITPVDNSTHYRNGAGDLLTDIGTRHRKQTLNLSFLSPADRAAMWNILVGNGMPKPILISLYPDDVDALLEQTHQLYCKLMTTGAMSSPSFRRFANSLDLEEV
jgi:hypothetical protein